MQQAETHRPLSLTGIATAGALVVLMLLALCTWGASAAQAGTLIVTKGGDRNVNSNSFTGGTNYAQNLSGAQFQYSSSASGPWTDIPGSTGSNGQVSITLSSGYYFVREKAAASGFANFGPLQTVNFNNGSQPYVARVQVTNSGTTYAHPHTNSSSNSSNWTPTNSNSGSNNNGSPFLDVRDNGTVENACGQNILLVLDRSGSIEPYKSSYEQAAKEFVNQLNGTPTQIGIISFNNSVNSYSPSQGNSNYYHAPLDLSSSGSAATLNGTIENVYNNPSSYTNWDGALQAAAGAKGFTANTSTGQTANPDLVVFITDGNPTTSQLGGTNGNTALTDISSGIASANLVKNQNSRRPGKKLKLLAIGVGSGVTASNLSVVSGPIQGVDGDYAVPTIPQLQSFLQELAATQCGARVYVRKRIAGGDGTNQPNWKYSAVDPRSGHTPSWMDGNNATHSTGSPAVIQTGAFFTNLPTNPTTVQVNENATGQPVSNFSLTGVVCRKGGYESGQTVNGTQSGLNYSLPVNRGDAIYCTYTNAVNTTLSINKTPDNQTINAGDDAEFTIVVANTGSNTATSALVSDQLPDPGVGGWTVSQQPSGGNCTVSGASLLGCTLGNLSAGQSRTIKVKTGTDKDYCGVYDNQAARASAANASEVTDAGKITCQKPSLEVVKSATNDPINAGEDAEFSITLTNNGPGVAKGATLSDPLPTGTAGAWTIVSQSGGPPACEITGSGANGGGTLDCGPKDLNKDDAYVVKVKAPTSAEACTTYENTATGSANNYSPDVQASATIDCETGVVGVLKTAVHGTINAGENAEFTIVTSNTGAGTAKNVTMTDPLPSGVSGDWEITDQPDGDPCSIDDNKLTCDFGDMASGASHSVTVSAPTDFENCTTLDNTASATSTNAPDASDSDSINCQTPSLEIDKSATNDTINAGDDAEFSITLTNNGPGVAKGATLSDPLPTGTAGAWTIVSQSGGPPACAITGSGANGGGTLDCGPKDLNKDDAYVVKVKAPTSAEACTTYENTATGSANNYSPDVQASATIDCETGVVGVLKTAVHGTINAGENAEFTIVTSNTGAGTAKNVTMTDPLPSGVSGDWEITDQPDGDPCTITDNKLTCDFGDMASGASHSVTVSAPSDFENCTTLDNTATATSSNANGDSSQASIDCLKPNLKIEKTPKDGSIDAGDDAAFTIVVSNPESDEGTGTATGVLVSDQLPSNGSNAWSVTSDPEDLGCAVDDNDLLDCGPFDLEAGEQVTITLTSKTDKDHCTVYDNGVDNENGATASAVNGGPPVTDSGMITCHNPNLATLKTAVEGTISAGDTASFTITVSNVATEGGTGIARDVTLDDPLPAGTSGPWTITDQPDGDPAPCAVTGDAQSGYKLHCEFGDLPAGEGGSRSVTVSAPTNFENCAVLDNTATASGSNAHDASDSDSIHCQKPNLTVHKSGNGTVNAGEDVEFTITVANSGPGVARNVTLSDSVPSGVADAWTISSQPGESCAISGGVLNCDFGDMDAESSYTVKITAPTDYEHCATYDNTATASASNSPDASGRDSVNCLKPEVNITKEGSGKTGTGQNVSFTIKVTNTGSGVARGVVVNDPLSDLAGPWSISSQSEGANCQIVNGGAQPAGTEGAPTLRCQVGDLKSGGTITVTVTAKMNPTVCQTINNTATVTSENAPERSDRAQVTCVKPRLQLRKKANRKAVLPGQKVRYTILVRNRKVGSVATNLRICDRIPPKMTVVNRGSGHFSNGRLCWKINRLEGSKKWTKRSYVTRVDRTANGGERLKNVVTLKNLRAHRTVRVKHPPVQHKRKRHTPVTG